MNNMKFNRQVSRANLVPHPLTVPLALVDGPEGAGADLGPDLNVLVGDLPHISAVPMQLLAGGGERMVGQ